MNYSIVILKYSQHEHTFRFHQSPFRRFIYSPLCISFGFIFEWRQSCDFIWNKKSSSIVFVIKYTSLNFRQLHADIEVEKKQSEKISQHNFRMAFYFVFSRFQNFILFPKQTANSRMRQYLKWLTIKYLFWTNNDNCAWNKRYPWMKFRLTDWNTQFRRLDGIALCIWINFCQFGNAFAFNTFQSIPRKPLSYCQLRIWSYRAHFRQSMCLSAFWGSNLIVTCSVFFIYTLIYYSRQWLCNFFSHIFFCFITDAVDLTNSRQQLSVSFFFNFFSEISTDILWSVHSSKSSSLSFLDCMQLFKLPALATVSAVWYAEVKSVTSNIQNKASKINKTKIMEEKITKRNEQMVKERTERKEQ